MHRRRQRVAIVRISLQRLCDHIPIRLARRGDAHLATKFIKIVNLPLSNALHAWHMYALKCLLALASMRKHSTYTRYAFTQPGIRKNDRNISNIPRCLMSIARTTRLACVSCFLLA
jgi:hypothetical protein